MIRILHTADWHIGDFPGPTEAGKNLRAIDTLNCIDAIIDSSREMKPDIVMISGDIFHQAKVWGSRALDEVSEAIDAIEELSRNASDRVIVMRGTPNHDGEEQFEMLAQYFHDNPKVEIVMEPTVILCEGLDVACIPGFDRGAFRAQFPGLGKEEEDAVITQELSKICIGLQLEGRPDVPCALMAHYTVPGCNSESGQSTFLQHFEPVLPTEALATADYDLVCLGHIHRPQQLPNVKKCFYSGAVNAMNFNDEDQVRGFWYHDMISAERIESHLYLTPYREFYTIKLDDDDVSQINSGAGEYVALEKWKGKIDKKIVRVIYECSLDNNKALNKAVLEKQLLEDGAFQVWEITPAKLSTVADRQNMENQTDPEENLLRYLSEKGYEEEKISQLISKARGIIAEANANNTSAALAGVFEPVSIDVKNYRNYVEEHFDFTDISFCTINGQNGSGKSSLFMDAIIDCLYEEPREGDLTGWIRNDESARSGSIAFVFKIGEQTFRVTRTRARSGKGTLNLSEFEDGEWKDRSCEKYRDTQVRIEQLLGMDSLTFKSCALIMQDQYGLFLQAPKEDRMVILGNLLGLNIYSLMEKSARDQAKIFGAKMRDAKQAISLHEATIDAYGDPEKDLETAEEALKKNDEQIASLTAEKQAASAELYAMEEAAKRDAAYTKEANDLAAELLKIEDRIVIHKDTIATCNKALADENAISDNVKEYRRAEQVADENLDAYTMYNAKMLELSRIKESEERLRKSISDAEQSLEEEQDQVNALIADSVNDGQILEKASLYADKKREYDAEIAKKTAHIIAMNAIDGKNKELDALQKTYNAETAAIDIRKNDLLRKTELLSSSGCIDPENAHCEFLKDAIAAKAKLECIDDEYAELDEAYQNRISVIESEKEELVKQAEESGFDESRCKDLEEELKSLSMYVNLAEEAKERKHRISVLEASIKPKRLNIADMQERLETVILEANSADSEAAKYSEAGDLYQGARGVMELLSGWLEKERDLPVIRERLNNATERLQADEDLAEKTRARIDEKVACAKEENAKRATYYTVKGTADRLDAEIEQCARMASMYHKSIGAAQQKIKDIEKIRVQISELHTEVSAFSMETADYDILKAAFSQDGIPHQIIRSVIPQLTDTANTILGQMTGGKMGIEFKTEKTMKSNTNKEVVTLDIMINEYGKSSLPYLSKSGGEKVKASLSVILALAEMKSTAAGIQLGMLFIDEPPFLDGDGIQAYCDALETIQNRYPTMKIMAITHDPTMKARFPQSLDVVKTEEGSKVIY